MNKRYVVSVSSGVPSAVAAKIMLDRFGHEVVDLVFMDTLREHADNYRFLDDLERVFNHKIIRLCEGHTPREIAEREKMIFNQRIALCTRVLKIEPFVNYLKSIMNEDVQLVVVLGMDASDKRRGRLVKPVINYGKLGAYVLYPLVSGGKKLEGQALHDIVKSWNIEVPASYQYGFKHANCLDEKNGGCFKFGLGDMRRLKAHFPTAYQNFMKWEQFMITNHELEGHGLLRQTISGETRYITLAEYDSQLQQQEAIQQNFFDLLDEISGNDCVTECGVSSYENEEQLFREDE